MGQVSVSAERTIAATPDAVQSEMPPYTVTESDTESSLVTTWTLHPADGTRER